MCKGNLKAISAIIVNVNQINVLQLGTPSIHKITPFTSNENGKFGEKSPFLYMWSFMEKELFMKARVQKISQLLV